MRKLWPSMAPTVPLERLLQDASSLMFLSWERIKVVWMKLLIDLRQTPESNRGLVEQVFPNQLELFLRIHTDEQYLI